MALVSTPNHAQRLLRLLASAALGLCCWLVAGRAWASESNASVTGAMSELESDAPSADAGSLADAAASATPLSGACDAAAFSLVSFASLKTSLNEFADDGQGDASRDPTRDEVGPQCDRRAASVPVAARTRVLRIRAYFDQGSAPALAIEEQHGALPEPDPSEASLVQSGAVDIWPAAVVRLPAPAGQLERGPIGLRVFLERPPR
jgi:hypothetical protein